MCSVPWWRRWRCLRLLGLTACPWLGVADDDRFDSRRSRYPIDGVRLGDETPPGPAWFKETVEAEPFAAGGRRQDQQRDEQQGVDDAGSDVGAARHVRAAEPLAYCPDEHGVDRS